MAELRDDMANTRRTITQIILHYLEDLYKETGQYKVSSKMVVKHFITARPNTAAGTIQQELSKLRRQGVITDLGESVPDQKGASYFVLTSILDKLTAAEKKEEEKAMSEEVKSISIVKQPNDSTPPAASVPTNPFDNVNSQLNRILMELNKLQAAQRDTAKEVAASLGDYTKDDAFIYLIREEILRAPAGTSIEKRLDEIETLWKISTDGKSNDYKEGIKDGIRMALELGLNGLSTSD